MSSFVISKQEYMKAAGLVSGLAEELKIWIYDYETGRNSNKEDYKRKFSECFTMNALSVQEQYHDSDSETDGGEYQKEFSEFYSLGKQLVYNGGKVLNNAILELASFFHSAMYQTERDEYRFKMQMLFDQITTELFRAASHYETQSWGELKIEKPDHTYSRIF